ncbi:unnamed protein product [Urochloa humidicola]
MTSSAPSSTSHMSVDMDDAFVQAPENRPKMALIEATDVPVIDISPMRMLRPGNMDALLSELSMASREWGIFMVVGHGILEGTVTRALEAGHTFFALPAEKKAAMRRTEAAPAVGYYDEEHLQNVRDWKEVFDFFPREPPPVGKVDDDSVFKNKWPEEDDLPGFRDALEEYANAMEKLAFMLLELIARSLNLKPDQFHGFFGDQTTIMRISRYPPCPRPDLALGNGHHKDSGALTILYQDDIGGLDVRRRSDGEWLRVKPIHGSFVVNIGDLIQVWTNDKYESMEHRVSLNSEKVRFSIPYFLNPSRNTVIEPLQEMVSTENPPKYNSYNWGEFFSTRRKAGFKKHVVQINTETAQFRKRPIYCVE